MYRKSAVMCERLFSSSGYIVNRDVPDIHPVPGKCRISHYSVLSGPGKIMGPSNKKKNFFLLSFFT